LAVVVDLTIELFLYLIAILCFLNFRMNQNIWLGLIKIIFDLADPRSKEIGVRQSAIGHTARRRKRDLVPIRP